MQIYRGRKKWEKEGKGVYGGLEGVLVETSRIEVSLRISVKI